MRMYNKERWVKVRPPLFFYILSDGSPLCISVVIGRGALCLTSSLYIFTLSAFIPDFFLNINILNDHFLIKGNKRNVHKKSPSISPVALILRSGIAQFAGMYIFFFI